MNVIFSIWQNPFSFSSPPCLPLTGFYASFKSPLNVTPLRLLFLLSQWGLVHVHVYCVFRCFSSLRAWEFHENRDFETTLGECLLQSRVKYLSIWIEWGETAPQGGSELIPMIAQVKDTEWFPWYLIRIHISRLLSLWICFIKLGSVTNEF